MYVQALSIEYTLEKPRPELGDIHFSPLFHRVSAICPVLHIFGKAHVPPVPCSSGQSPSHSVHVDLPHHTALSHGSEKSSFAKLSAEGCSRSDLHDADAASPAGHVPLSHTDLSPLPMKPSVANSAGHEADTTPPIAPGHNINHPPNITTTTHPVLQASHETHAETAAWSTYSVCLHVHGCYPYFMVPQYDPSITATQFGAQLEAVALQVLHQQQRAAQYNNSNASRPATSFRAVTVTVGDNDNEGATTQPESRWGNRYNSADNTYGYGSHYYGWRDRRTPQLVHDVELIERMPFYGYHAEPCAFFKVHVIDPSRMQWLMSLLHDTSYIGGRHWRLFEGHNKFHSQFMVDYDLSGIAPVMLRRGCHVRQPTVPEFSPAGEANEYDDEEYNYGREGGDDEDYVPTEEERKKAEELRRMREEQRLAYARMLATHYGIDQVHPADDPPRESTCELELDVAAHVLTTDTTTTTTTTTSNSNSKEKYARVREPGANLAHLRRLIQRYFAEHGVDDALRVAKTMAVEEEELEAWRRGGGVAMPMTMMDNTTTSAVKADSNAQNGVKNKTSEEAERARDKKTAAPAKTEEAALRYGSVIQIQRNDAMLTAMREKMVEFVQARPASENISTEDAYCHTRHHKEGLQTGLPVDMTQQSVHPESGHTQELFDALAVPLAQRQQLLSLSQRVLAPLSFSTNSSLEETHNSTLAIEAGQAKAEADTTPKDIHATQTTALLLGEELPDVPPPSTNVVEVVHAALAVPHTSADAMHHSHEDADDEDEILLLSDDTYHDNKVSPKYTPHTAHKNGEYAEDDSDPPPLFSSMPTIPTSSYSPQRRSPSMTPQTTQRTAHSPLPPPAHHITPVEEEDDEEVILLRSTSPSPTQQLSTASRQASAHSAHTIIQSDDEALLVSDTKSRSDTEDEARGGEAVVETPVICPSVQILSAPSLSHRQQGSVVDDTSIGSPAKELPQVKDEEEEEVLDCDEMTCSVVTVHSPSSQGVTSGPSLNAVQAALLRELRQGSLVRLTSTLLSELVPELPRVTFTLRYKTNSVGNTTSAVGMVCVDIAPPWPMRNRTQMTYSTSIQNKGPQKTIQTYVNEQDNKATTTAANDNSVAMCQRRSVPLMTCVRRGSAGSGSAEVAALPVIDRRARLKRLAAINNKAGEEEEDDDVDRVVLAENRVNAKGDEAEELAESSPRFSAGREHALQCVLRVMCVEVLLRRRCNVQLLSADPLRAIALGTTTSSSDDVSITIYCVKVNSQQGLARSYELSAHVQIVELDSEAEMLQQACEAILRADPDLLLSWEGYKYGIGLFSLRYGIVLHRSLARDLSRLHRGNPYCPPQSQNTTTTNTNTTTNAHYNSVYRRRAAFMQHVSARNNNTNLTGYAMRPTTFTRLSAQDHYERAKRAAHYTVRIPMQTSRRLRRLQRKRAEANKGTAGTADKVKTRNNPRRRFFAVAAAAAAAGGGMGNVEGQANFVAEGVGLTIEGEDEEGSSKAITSEANRTTAQVQHAAENHKDDNKGEEEEDIATRTARQYAKRFGANVRIAGRVCVSLSKSIRKEVKLPSYSLTMAYQSLLKATLPYFADTVLAAMYDGRQSVADTNEEEEQPASTAAALHAMALHYLVSRVIAPHRIARHLHHYARTMEYSRMFGILFEEVMTRGSQFRVEATLRRMTGPQGYVMLSPSRAMVYRQPRIQCIPLIMQPLCDFYHDPVVVLDFRSLYPSMIIAYNLCYSTCVGMVQPDTCSRLGVLPDYVQDNALLAELVPDDGDGFDHVTLTPNGAMFVKPSTRVGVLPEMIRTVLDTRVELQAALQHVAIPTKAIETQQRLGEQQQALKMLANVTYGYTGASYTGRMPCVDLAEAIVSLARQTLERAIALVEETTQWRARVIYGDTDSMFVWLPGRTRAEAFTIGAEIARAVTAANPAPVRLQFEKVLQPCFLVVKKRYVGYAWYNPSQLEPQYLAKGIETERRDQCAATTKLTRAMIERYFRDKANTSTQTSSSKPTNVKDGSVKELRAFYVQQVSKLQRGDCNPADCIFRRAVKLGRYKDESHLPLGAHLALQLMERDLANTPFWGERVPYVVVRRLGRQELKQRVVQPEQMLFVNRHLVLDADYYIHRHLNAALDRIFYLVNISCAQWYSELPRRRSSTTGGAQRYAELQGFLQLKARQSIAHPLWWERIAEYDNRSNNTNNSGVCYAARMQRKRRRSAIEAELRRGYAEDTAIVIDEEVDRVSEGSTVLHEEGNVRTSVDKQNREVVIVVDEDNDDDDEEVQKEEDKKKQQMNETNKESVIQVKHLQQSKLTTLLAAPNTLTGPSDARLNTLDAYYPRVLCVCCEQNIVTLAEQQRDFLAFMVDVSEVRDADRIAAAQLSHSRQGESSREGLMRATSLPALQALAAVPPICASCWASPLQLYSRIMRRYARVTRRLRAAQRACACCMGGCGTVNGPAFFARLIRNENDEDDEEYDENIASVPQRDMEDLASAAPHVAVPRELTGAIAEYDPNEASTHHEMYSELGCSSIDCPISFEKKRLTQLADQLRALQWYLQEVTIMLRCYRVALTGGSRVYLGKPTLPQLVTLPQALHTTVCRCSQGPSAVQITDSTNDALSSPSPFLASLLDPPQTVPLVDATRTYDIMDIAPECDVYDPTIPNATHVAAAPSTETSASKEDNSGSCNVSEGDERTAKLRAAQQAGQLWQAVHALTSNTTDENNSSNEPPAWFEQLCKDLYYRTNSTDELDEVAALSDPLLDERVTRAAQGKRYREMPEEEEGDVNISDPQKADATREVDPYLWLPFDLLDVAQYHIAPYTFATTCPFTPEQQRALCLDDIHRPYIHFCNTYAFPARWQIPTSLGTIPAKLYIDPCATTPVVYVQLGPEMPPAMWLPVRPTAAALRRVLGAYAQMATLHRDWHHSHFAARAATVRRVMALQQMSRQHNNSNNAESREQAGDVLRMMAYEARNVQHVDAPLREFVNQQDFFCGEYDDPERLVEHFDLCPFLFAIPHLRSVTDVHAEHMTPTIEGPGVAASLFRCIYSKTLILVTVQLSAEVKLPPQDPEAFRFMWSDAQAVPKMKIAVFARIMWPDNIRLSGGGQLNTRINALFNTEFASDIPPDAVMALLYIAQWANGNLHQLAGVRAMRQRVAELEFAALEHAEPPRLYPSTRELPNPEYTNAERLGMHIQYLAHVNDPSISETIERLMPRAPAPVRMGCAKAALIAGDRALFRRIVGAEPAGRMQVYMTKIVRKRKTRDLLDAEPRLLEDQYEFAAPLWTKRNARLDRNTLEGAVAAKRLAR